MEEHKVRQDTTELKRFWYQRNVKFKEWYEFLVLIDQLYTRNMESYVSNEPQTFYNMAHYLLTKGQLSHMIPVETESSLELDKRAKVHRGCNYMWQLIDRERKLGGGQSFIDELGHFLITLGWYSVVLRFNSDTGRLETQIWNPYDTYPRFVNNQLAQCLHSYKISEIEAESKAAAKGWRYTPVANPMGEVAIDDYYYLKDGIYHNMILLNGQDVTGWVPRPDMTLLVAPVAGFPDKGSAFPSNKNWTTLAGRSVFEANATVSMAFNKWKSMMAQILRDSAQPIVQEFSSTPVATPEQIRERGGLFHYAPGEPGLQRLPPGMIPIELQAHLAEIRREMQKGSFNDVVYGMAEGQQAGYALSLLATSSANQILYPYMDAKHFIVSEHDRFWLSHLKTSRRTFDVKGHVVEKLKPTDIPEDVTVIVESDVATPKDWLERGTIANQLKDHLDHSTIIEEVLRLPDPQNIKRRMSIDRMMQHPTTQMVEMISGYNTHANYLELRGDMAQAELFREAAMALKAQLGIPPPGSASPTDHTSVAQKRKEGAPAEQQRVRPDVQPPEERGVPPAELRERIGRGTMRRVTDA